MLPEPRLARQIIDVLGQSGTPLSKGVSYYNVGNESLLNAIDTHYLGSYLADGGAVFKLVVGDYGSGKSHFLYCVRDRAWARDFAVSKVDLSPKESPYDDQRRVYAAVASSIIWHELGDLGEDERGLERNFMQHDQPSYFAFAPDSLITLAHKVTSLSRSAAYCSGVPDTGSAPSSAKRFLTSAVASAELSALLSLSMIGRGTPAGATSA